jgi:hypothetical protein
MTVVTSPLYSQPQGISFSIEQVSSPKKVNENRDASGTAEQPKWVFSGFRYPVPAKRNSSAPKKTPRAVFHASRLTLLILFVSASALCYAAI